MRSKLVKIKRSILVNFILTLSIERNEDNVSDHYPIYFKLSCLDEADKLH